MHSDEKVDYFILFIMIMISLIAFLNLIGSFFDWRWNSFLFEAALTAYRKTIRLIFEGIFPGSLPDYVAYSLFFMGKISRTAKIVYGMSLREFYCSYYGDGEGWFKLILSYIFAPIILLGVTISGIGFVLSSEIRSIMLRDEQAWIVARTIWILLLIDVVAMLILRYVDQTLFS